MREHSYHIVERKRSPVSSLTEQTMQENEVFLLGLVIFLDCSDFESVQFHIQGALSQRYSLIKCDMRVTVE